MRPEHPMNQLNLIPKVPFAARYFVLLAVVIVLAIGGAGASLYLFNKQINLSTSLQRAEGEHSKQLIQSLESDRRIDPAVRELAVLMGEFSALQDARKDWVPVLRAIAAAMPNTSRTTQAGIQNGTINMTVEFVSLEEAAQYVLRLGRDPLFEEANLKNVTAKPIGNGSSQNLYESSISITLKPADSSKAK